jgi:hypothetical protein
VLYQLSHAPIPALKSLFYLFIFLTQGFALAKQALYHLSSITFYSDYFGDGGLLNYLFGLATGAWLLL